MAVFVFLVFFLALTGQSYANYCLCRDGVSQQVLQKALDYACGAGADCSPILSNGACFQPNTVKDHCSYAVNSYFQRKGQVQGSCDFSGAATPSVSLTASVPSGCVYPSNPSNAGTSPTTSGGTTPGTTNPGMTPSVFGNGISPSGSGAGFNDGSGGVGFNEKMNLLLSVGLTLWLSVLLF
ncbi:PLASMODESMATA CALLOSE-BINDING PROTEIN 3 [Cucurbita maxima]|uniref:PLASMODESMATA CALLOSE-BINDING PROTEIN 3 n=1 Tax=Cucurbita maxima TaxID=3661 RepID=A0A6J1HZW3_CUCMA|nr:PLASMODESMATA CALLOSE-BINDING PROTEIN 3 [Cucurbita maxima]